MCDRLTLLRRISDWFHDEAEEFATKDLAYQLAVLKMVRILVRWTKLSDNLNGFMEVVFEGVLSTFFQVIQRYFYLWYSLIHFFMT